MSEIKKSQWEQIFELGLFEQVWTFYANQNFPTSLRACLTPQWLEYHIGELEQKQRATPENPNDAPLFELFMSNFLQEIQTYTTKKIELCYASRDIEGIRSANEIKMEAWKISSMYQNNGASLYSTIKSCLNYEKELINQKLSGLQNPMKQTSGDTNYPTLQFQDNSVITRYEELNRRLNMVIQYSGLNGLNTPDNLLANQLKQIREDIADISQLKIDLNTTKEDIQVAMQESQANGVITVKLNLLQTTWTTINVELKEKISYFRQNVFKFVACLKNGVNNLKSLNNSIIELIEEWRAEQIRAANGVPMMHDIACISSIVKTAASAILEYNRYLLVKSEFVACLSENGEQCESLTPQLNQLKAELDQMVMILVPKSFIVDKQPPQILRLKATIKQPFSVNLLCGSILIPTETPEVKAILIDKEEAIKVHANPFYVPKPSLKLKNNTATMAHSLQSGAFCAQFTSVTLPDKRKCSENDKRRGSKSSDDQEDEHVPRKKYTFYIQTTFQPRDLPAFTISTTTLPVIVTCHPNQDADAWATVLWYNAFSIPNGVPYDVTHEVDPSELMRVLSYKFRQQTNKSLSPSHMEFLQQKLMRGCVGKATWNMFAENKIECSVTKKPDSSKKETKITFNYWLYQILRMCEPSPAVKGKKGLEDTKESNAKGSATCSISQYWQGKFIQFITKEMLYFELEKSPPGTFIIYFSEAILGALTVAWFNRSDNTVNKYAPYELQELKDHSLEARILESEHLIYLYPGIHKDSVFKKLRNSNGLTDIQWSLIKQGYVLHTQKQVDVTLPEKLRQLSTSSSHSATSPASTCSRRSSSNQGSPYSTSNVHSPGANIAFRNNFVHDWDYRPNTELELYEILENFEP